MAKDAALKAADGSELKVGDKVTVHYTMIAKSIDAKKEPAKEKKAPAKAAASPAATPSPSPAAES